MSPLQAECERLYGAGPGATPGTTRGLVLELGRPADWQALALVWRGVQSDLELPAPAIAVNGVDGHQLWFALAQPVALAQAEGFLAALQERYLGAVAAQRIRLWPNAHPALEHACGNTPSVPRQQANSNWSAWVAPDLAAVFSDEPWLDMQPGQEAQARVLSDIACITPPAFEAACDKLQPQPPAVRAGQARAVPLGRADDAKDNTPAARGPRQFLQDVINDEGAPLALRIEAARALLPYSEG